MMMGAREHDCVYLLPLLRLLAKSHGSGKVIQCMRGVMRLQGVWGTGNCKGVGILEIEENVWAERIRVQASY